jgi:serine/threonine protein kinase
MDVETGIIDREFQSILSTASSSNDFNSIYEIINEIGRGGFSIVYQCQHRVSKQIYAVKVLSSIFSSCR